MRTQEIRLHGLVALQKFQEAQKNRADKKGAVLLQSNIEKGAVQNPYFSPDSWCCEQARALDGEVLGYFGCVERREGWKEIKRGDFGDVHRWGCECLVH
jgi:hypothetical protein